MSSKEKMQNWVKGIMWRSREPILEFWDPRNISQMVEARKFKFGTETDGVSSNVRNAKLGQKGSLRCHVTQFWNFLIPLIYQ